MYRVEVDSFLSALSRGIAKDPPVRVGRSALVGLSSEVIVSSSSRSFYVPRAKRHSR